MEPTPKNLARSSLATSCLILEAATIFIALVIFLMDSTDFIRILISFKLLAKLYEGCIVSIGDEAESTLFISMLV